MNYITIPERIILESLNEGAKSAQDLAHSTKIDIEIVNRILKQFLIQKITILNQNMFQINLNLDEQIKSKLNNSESIKAEINEILGASIHAKIDSKKEDSLRLKKVYMNEKEEKIYKGLLYNLESFVSSLGYQKGQIANKKIIFWGENTYENIINYTLNA